MALLTGLWQCDLDPGTQNDANRVQRVMGGRLYAESNGRTSWIDFLSSVAKALFQAFVLKYFLVFKLKRVSAYFYEYLLGLS